MYYIIDELMLYFLIFLPAFSILLLVLVFYAKMPKPAKAIITAWLRKRDLIAKKLANHLYDFVPAKLRDRYLWVSKDEVYDPLRSGNPHFSTRDQLRGTSITIWFATGKSVAASPSQLEALQPLAEAEEEEIPKGLKDWSNKHGIDLDDILKEREKFKKAKEKIEKKGGQVGILPTLKTTIIDMIFPKVPDLSARRVLFQIWYNMGLKDAGKQYMKMGLVIGVCAIIGLALLGFMLMSGGI